MICLKCGENIKYDNAIYCPSCGFKLKEVTVEKLFLPTPNGGIRSEISYYDEEGKPCSKLMAAKIEVKEYDKAGKEVHSFSAHRRTAEEKAEEEKKKAEAQQKKNEE